MIHHNNLAKVFIILGFVFALLGLVDPASGNYHYDAGEPQDIQIVLSMDVSTSMNWRVLPDDSDLPEDLVYLRERLNQIENDPEFIRLSKAVDQVETQPQVLSAMDEYSNASKLKGDWLVDNGYGDLAEIEIALQDLLDRLGCVQYWGASGIIWSSNSLEDAYKNITENDCRYVAIDQAGRMEIEGLLVFMANEEYQVLHQAYVQAWDVYQEVRSEAGNGIYEEYDRFLASLSYETIKDQVIARAEELGFPTKLELAQLSAQTMLDLSRLDNSASGRVTRVGLVEFALDGKLVQPFSDNYGLLDEKVSELSLRGWTNVGDGLVKALDQIEANGNPEQPSLIILLSDGESNIGMNSLQILEQIPARAERLNTRICSVGFGVTEGDVDVPLLSGLAEQTGGKYLFAASGEELMAVFIACRQTLITETLEEISGLVHPGETIEAGSVMVGGDVDVLTLTLAYMSGDLEIELVDPSGRIIGLDDPSITIEKGDNLQLITIENPMPSEWVVRVRARQAPDDGSIYSLFYSSETLPDAAPTLAPTATATLAPVPPPTPSTMQLALPSLIGALMIIFAVVVLTGIVLLILRLRKAPITNRHLLFGGAGLLVIFLAVLVGAVFSAVRAQERGESAIAMGFLDSWLTTATPTSTATFTMTPTMTATPTFTPQPSPTYTLTPTATPTLTATPIPIIIQPGNSANLALLGEPIYNDADITWLDTSPDGHFLISRGWYNMPHPLTGWRGQVQIWRVLVDELLPFGRITEDVVGDYIADAIFSPDGSLIASGLGTGAIHLWRVEDQTLVHQLTGHKSDITDLAFSPDGDKLAASSEDKTVKVWRVANGELLFTISGYQYNIYALDFSYDGNLLAVGSQEFAKLVRIFDANNGKPLRTMGGHGDTVVSLSFSPAADILATGALDKAIILWDASSGRRLFTLRGHTDHIKDLAFSPDGKLLASASADQTVKLWDVQDGSLLETLDDYVDVAGALAFSPDGSRLFTGSWDAYIRIFAVSP